MKASEFKCRKCGGSIPEASSRGAYLARINEKGVPGIWECVPCCEHKVGTQEDALINAIIGI